MAEGPPLMASPEELSGKTALGMDPQLTAVLAYFLGVISGIIVLVMEKENHYVRFHAMQSILTFAAIWVLNVVLRSTSMTASLLVIVSPLSLMLWLFLMYKAYQGERFELPVVGEVARKQVYDS